MKHVAVIVSMLVGASAMASVIECKKVSPSALGVETVRFSSQDVKAHDVDTLLVSYESGNTQEYRALPGHAFGLVPGSETRTSTFQGDNGLASVRYSFFVLPEDKNPHGWSAKNGVTLSTILPPATEKLNFTCKRQLP